MDRETQDRCKGCKHCWDSQCCNISAHVQRAYGVLGKCRFFAAMPPREMPTRQRMTASAA
jgi:hypothetical protein